MKKLLRNKKGFTLIELIVVIAILAILAAILIPTLLNYIQEANKAKDQANARSYFTSVALEVAVANPSPADGAYTPTSPKNPCDSISVVLADGAIDSFSCTIDGHAYTLAADFAKS